MTWPLSKRSLEDENQTAETGGSPLRRRVARVRRDAQSSSDGQDPVQAKGGLLCQCGSHATGTHALTPDLAPPNPDSSSSFIAALAKLIRWDFKNVHADLKLLADLGLVHLEPGAHMRDSVTPTVPYERIQFEIAV